jgi:hypothetical protein
MPLPIDHSRSLNVPTPDNVRADVLSRAQKY